VARRRHDDVHTTGKARVVRSTTPDLQSLSRLIDAGEYRAVIDRVYPIEDVVEAHRYVETHPKTGNVVLTIS
jgi:NADPH:quinone reductase-like Zn-dependent oxidoreductase